MGEDLEIDSAPMARHVYGKKMIDETFVAIGADGSSVTNEGDQCRDKLERTNESESGGLADMQMNDGWTCKPARTKVWRKPMGTSGEPAGSRPDGRTVGQARRRGRMGDNEG